MRRFDHAREDIPGLWTVGGYRRSTRARVCSYASDAHSSLSVWWSAIARRACLSSLVDWFGGQNSTDRLPSAPEMYCRPDYVQNDRCAKARHESRSLRSLARRAQSVLCAVRHTLERPLISSGLSSPRMLARRSAVSILSRCMPFESCKASAVRTPRAGAHSIARVRARVRYCPLVTEAFLRQARAPTCTASRCSTWERSVPGVSCGLLLCVLGADIRARPRTPSCRGACRTALGSRVDARRLHVAWAHDGLLVAPFCDGPRSLLDVTFVVSRACCFRMHVS
jgi:hypothetical protein